MDEKRIYCIVMHGEDTKTNHRWNETLACGLYFYSMEEAMAHIDFMSTDDIDYYEREDKDFASSERTDDGYIIFFKNGTKRKIGFMPIALDEREESDI